MSAETERIAMFRDCLVAIAPVYARDAIRKLGTIVGDVYDPAPQSDAVTLQRRQVASETAELAAQFALHLASKYAEFYEAVAPETQDSAQTRIQAQTSIQAAKNPAAKVR